MLTAGFYNMDCLEAMRGFPDGFFDLAIVDPPYGDGGKNIGGGRRFGGLFDRYKVEQIRRPIRPIQNAGTDLLGERRSENISGGQSEPGEHGRSVTGKKL